MVECVITMIESAQKLMAELKFYKLIFDLNYLKTYLISKKLLIDAEEIRRRGLTCRNARCQRPDSGFINSTRKRRLSTLSTIKLDEEGQNVDSLITLRCKSCKTFLSPRTGGFLTYMDRNGRSRTNIAPEKALQIIFHWITKRKISDSVQLLSLNKSTLIDWHNFCRTVCREMNIIAFQRKLGVEDIIFHNELPLTVVQIDECLLRGKRKYNRGRMLNGDQNIPLEDREEWHELHDDLEININPNQNYGMRINGPWIFGMAECHLDISTGIYKTGEIRLFTVDRRNADTLLPIIRNHCQRGSMIWSDQWASYNGIGSDDDGLFHQSVNHSEQFISDMGVHTQNIERYWGEIRLKIIKTMRGTSPDLLQSHLEELMYRSRSSRDYWELFESFLDASATIYPIDF